MLGRGGFIFCGVKLVGWLVGRFGLDWIGLDWVGWLVGWFYFVLFCCWWIFSESTFLFTTIEVHNSVWSLWMKQDCTKKVGDRLMGGRAMIYINNELGLVIHTYYIRDKLSTTYLQSSVWLQRESIVLAWAVMARSPLFKISCSSELSSLQTHLLMGQRWEKNIEQQSKVNTPWKINMEPENDGLEDDFPLQLGDF